MSDFNVRPGNSAWARGAALSASPDETFLPPPTSSEPEKEVPPSLVDWKRLTAEVADLGFATFEVSADAEGRIPIEKWAEAKARILAEASRLRSSDPEAVAHFLQKSIELVPADPDLRLEAARVWRDWGVGAADPEAQQARLKQAFAFLEPVKYSLAKTASETTTLRHALAMKLVGFGIARKEFSQGSYYLGEAIRSLAGDKLEEWLQTLAGRIRPELLGERKDVFQFFAYHLIEAGRYEEAERVFRFAARNAPDEDGRAAYTRYFQIIHEGREGPKKNHQAALRQAQGVLDLAAALLDARGYYRDSAEITAAKTRIANQTVAWMAGPEGSGLRVGEEAFERGFEKFLHSQSEFPFLPLEAQAALRSEGFATGRIGEEARYFPPAGRGSEEEGEPSASYRRKAHFLSRQARHAGAEGGFAEAVVLYREALRLDPKLDGAQIELAEVYLEWGRNASDTSLKKFLLETGLEYGEKSLEQETSAQAFRIQGEILSVLGKPAEARLVLRRALELPTIAASQEGQGLLALAVRAAEIEGLALQAQRASAEPNPADTLRDRLEEQGVAREQVARPLGITPERVTSRDYVAYAFRDFAAYRGLIEESLGPLPFGAENGPLDPQLREVAEAYLLTRERRLEADLISQGLEKDSPAFREALSQALGKKDDPWAAAYAVLLDPERSPAERAEAFYYSQARSLQVAAMSGLDEAERPRDLQNVFRDLQNAAEAFKRAFAVGGNPAYLREAAAVLYQAAGLARQAGERDKAKVLFLRGATILQFGGEIRGAATFYNDPAALSLAAEGLREGGDPESAFGYWEAAQVAADPELKPRIGERLAWARRRADTERSLGEAFLQEVGALRAAEQAGTISAADREKLRHCEAGLHLLETVDALTLPGYRGPWLFASLREDILRATQVEDTVTLQSLGETVRRQVANMAIFSEADRLRRESFLPALPEHVQEHIRRTGDWSVLSEDYRGKSLPEGWNAERLNDMPLLKVLRERQKSDPKTAARWSELLQSFAQPTLFAERSGTGPRLAELDARAERLLGLLASDPEGAGPKHALSSWLQEARSVEEEKRPEIFFSPETHVAKLRDLAALLQGLQQGKEEDRRLRDSGFKPTSDGAGADLETDSASVKAFQSGLEKTRENFSATFRASVAAFAKDVENYQVQVRRLGKLDEDNSAPYQVGIKESLAALQQVEATLTPSGDLGADLEAMIAAAECLAGAQARLLQGVSLIEISNFKGFAPGRLQASAKTADWIADPRWQTQARDLDRAFGELSILDAAGIHRLLRARESYLREVLPEKFQDLRSSLKAGIAEQISLWTKARIKKLDNGDEVHDYDRLLQDYRAADSALEAGDLPRALALFRIATDGKRRAGVEENFSEFQSRQSWKAFALEIGVLTAAGMATAATLGSLLPAAVSAGTAALGTEIFVAGMEGAVMTGSELLIRRGLYEAAERGGKRYGLSVVEDPALKFDGAGDLAWKAVGTAGMLRFLKGAGRVYQGAVLGEQALSRAGARSLLDTAAKAGAGRAMGRQLLGAELSGLGFGGKALYQAGAFGMEAAALQAWSNIAAPLDMLYARVAHGQALRWDGLGERLATTNSVDALEESLRTLAGLKLGGMTAHPIGARLQTRAEKSATLRAKLETLKTTEQAFLKKYQELRGRGHGDTLGLAEDGALRAEAERLAELMKGVRGEIGALKRKGKSPLSPKEEAAFLVASDSFLAWAEGAGRVGEMLSRFQKGAQILAFGSHYLMVEPDDVAGRDRRIAEVGREVYEVYRHWESRREAAFGAAEARDAASNASVLPASLREPPGSLQARMRVAEAFLTRIETQRSRPFPGVLRDAVLWRVAGQEGKNELQIRREVYRFVKQSEPLVASYERAEQAASAMGIENFSELLGSSAKATDPLFDSAPASAVARRMVRLEPLFVGMERIGAEPLARQVLAGTVTLGEAYRQVLEKSLSLGDAVLETGAGPVSGEQMLQDLTEWAAAYRLPTADIVAWGEALQGMPSNERAERVEALLGAFEEEAGPVDSQKPVERLDAERERLLGILRAELRNITAPLFLPVPLPDNLASTRSAFVPITPEAIGSPELRAEHRGELLDYLLLPLTAWAQEVMSGSVFPPELTDLVGKDPEAARAWLAKPSQEAGKSNYQSFWNWAQGRLLPYPILEGLLARDNLDADNRSIPEEKKLSPLQARAFIARYREVSEALGLNDFNARFMERARREQARDFAINPSLAAEALLEPMAEAVDLLRPVLAGMDPASRKLLAGRILVGRISLDHAKELREQFESSSARRLPRPEEPRSSKPSTGLSDPDKTLVSALRVEDVTSPEESGETSPLEVVRVIRDYPMSENISAATPVSVAPSHPAGESETPSETPSTLDQTPPTLPSPGVSRRAPAAPAGATIPSAVKAMGPLAVGLFATWPSVADAMSLLSSATAQVQGHSAASSGLWALAASGLAIGVGAVFGSRPGPGGGEPPLDSAVKTGPIVTFPDGQTRYSLGAYQQGARDTWPEGQMLGRVLWTVPMVGDPEGSMNLEVLPFQSILGPIVMDPIQITMTAEQAASLGIPPGSNGDFAEASAPLLKLILISPPVKRSPPPPAPFAPNIFRSPRFGLPVDHELEGRRYRLTPANSSDLEDWNAEVVEAKFDSSGMVRVDCRIRKNRYLDQEDPLSLSLSPKEAEQVGLRFDAEGRWEPSGPTAIQLIPRGPVAMPAFDLEGPLPEGVAGVLHENRDASPRRGEIGVIGQSSGQTDEGVGYKPRNEDALVEGPGWAAVIDGMGGHADGDQASAIAGKALAHYLEAHKKDPVEPKELVRRALIYAGDAVNYSPYGKRDAAAVAIVQLRVPMEDGRTKLVLGWVGDAGAVIARPDGTIHRTEDQGVLRGILLKKDKSPEALELEKRTHPRNAVSAGSLGGKEESVPSLEEHILEPGSRVALFSDGFDSLSTGEIVETLRRAGSPEEARRESFDLAKQKMEIFSRAKANFNAVFPGFQNMSRVEREKLRVFIVTPRGEHAYMDVRGRVYRLRSGGEPIDFYKPDNLTVYVAFF